MEVAELIETVAWRVRLRRRLRLGILLASIVLVACGSVALFLRLAFGTEPLFLLAVALLSALAGFIVGFLRVGMIPHQAAAFLIDTRLRLPQVFLTLVDAAPSAFRPLIEKEAAAAAEARAPALFVPLNPGWRLFSMLGLAAALVLASFWVSPLQSEKEKMVRAAVRHVAAAQKELSPPANRTQRRIVRRLQSVKESLKRKQQRLALAECEEIKRDLERLKSVMEQDLRALEEMGQDARLARLAEAAARQDASALLEAGEKLGREGKEALASAAEKAAQLASDRLARALQNLARAARSQSMQDLQEALGELSKVLRESDWAGMEGEQLERALGELEKAAQVLRECHGQEGGLFPSGEGTPSAGGEGEGETTPAVLKGGGGTTQENAEGASPHTPGLTHEEGPEKPVEGRDVEQPHAPRRTSVPKMTVYAPTLKGKGLVLELLSAGGVNGQKVDVRRLLPQARQKAERAVESEVVPSEYRDLVRRYFDELAR